MASPTVSRVSTRLTRRLLETRQPYRCLSCTNRIAQQEQTKQDARTTHFGFENVPEAEKESRGINPAHPPHNYARPITIRSSQRRLLLRRHFLRQDERPNVPRHPPPLERPLRPLSKPRLPANPPNNARHSRRNRRHRFPSPRPRFRYK